eukprot:7382741-Prymnesium_polylepis.3
MYALAVERRDRVRRTEHVDTHSPLRRQGSDVLSYMQVATHGHGHGHVHAHLYMHMAHVVRT